MAAMAIGSLSCLLLAATAQAQDVIFRDSFETRFAFPNSDGEAIRFLTQATMGPRRAEAPPLRTLGYNSWIDQQIALPPTLTWTLMQQGFPGCAGQQNCGRNERMDVWYWAALGGQDQLRQRMAWSLSQIFVTSDFGGPLEIDGDVLTRYNDLLIRGAFKPFRELLQDVTLAPQMAHYLTMFKNQRPDVIQNIRPDENFAREIMQLFSIGLWELNANGSFRLDGGGNRIPTYNQNDIRNLARVFTGWNWAGSTQWDWGPQDWTRPIEIYRDSPANSPDDAFGSFHDFQPKTYLGLSVPGNLTGEEDLRRALDRLASHPNTAPFISRQLIQRMVTSNPTPGYISRVVERWNASGGNLGEVARAILTDVEARNGHLDPATRNIFGRLREPMLRETALMRGFRGRAPGNRPFSDWNPESDYFQAPFRSPTVFYFYRPDYSPPGPVASANYFAPEFQITTESWIASTTSRIHSQAHGGGRVGNSNPTDYVVYDFNEEAAFRNDPTALVEHLNVKLLGGQMSDAMRALLVAHAGNVPSNIDDGYRRVRSTMALILSSTDFAIQR